MSENSFVNALRVTHWFRKTEKVFLTALNDRECDYWKEVELRINRKDEEEVGDFIYLLEKILTTISLRRRFQNSFLSTRPEIKKILESHGFKIWIFF